MKKLALTILLACATIIGVQAQEKAFSQKKDSVINFSTIERIIDAEVNDSDFLYHYKFWDNWFIGASTGVSLSMSENTRFAGTFESIKPSFQFEIGKYFFPSFGMRATLGYKPQKGRANFELADMPHFYDANGAKIGNPFGFYDFNVFAGYLDAMVNFTNIVLPYREHRFFNLIGIIGLGYNYSFGFDKGKLDEWMIPNKYYYTPQGAAAPNANSATYPVDYEPHNYFAGHAGLQARFRVSDEFDIVAEAVFNGTDDAYNGVQYDRVYDTYVDGLIGFTYHFRDSHLHHRFRYINYDKLKLYDSLIRAKLNKEKAKETALQAEVIDVPIDSITEQLQTTISFYIDRYYITDAQKKNVKAVAKFLEKHPDVNLVVTGYADIQTAYPAYNMRLSKRRANAVRNMLIKDYGVDPNRLELAFHGDAEQPYATVNEWNRAVVFKMKSNKLKVDDIYPIITGGEAGSDVVVIKSNDDFTSNKYAGNTNIKKVVIQKGVTEVPDGAFEGCWALESVQFPEGLKKIGAKAFNGTILQICTFPSTLDYIGDEAFINSSMVEVDIPSGHKPQLGKNVLGTTSKFIMRVRVPAGAISTFKRDPEWNRCDNITNIGAYWNLGKK